MLTVTDLAPSTTDKKINMRDPDRMLKMKAIFKACNVTLQQVSDERVIVRFVHGKTTIEGRTRFVDASLMALTEIPQGRSSKFPSKAPAAVGHQNSIGLCSVLDGSPFQRPRQAEKPTDDMADSFMETTSDSSRPLPAGSELVAPTTPPC